MQKHFTGVQRVQCPVGGGGGVLPYMGSAAGLGAVFGPSALKQGIKFQGSLSWTHPKQGMVVFIILHLLGGEVWFDDEMGGGGGGVGAAHEKECSRFLISSGWFLCRYVLKVT